MRQARFGPKNIVAVARPQRNISRLPQRIMIASALYASFICRQRRASAFRIGKTSSLAPNVESNPHTFNFGLESGEVINPEIGGNEARWINHCCDPNCEAIEEDDRIFIYALRDIEPGQELFYDYAMEIDEPITKKLENEFKCHCGAARCRGTMLSL